jgi:molybdenum cofactor cytidylyltransferase
MAGPASGAVVLAAGTGRRMGGRLKPLIECDGVPLVRRVALALHEAGAAEVVVVVGHRAAEVAAALDPLPVRCVVNEAYADGRTTSVRAGLTALAPNCAPVIIALADQPLLTAADVATLLEAYASCGGARAMVPRVGDLRGHPVILGAGVREEILAAGDGFGVRQWLDANPTLVAWFDSDNVHYVTDVDRPEDLARAGL